MTNLVKDLRRKLKQPGVPGQPISTVHGLGYKLGTPPAKTEAPSQIKGDRISQLSPIPFVQCLFETVQTPLQAPLTVMNNLALALQQDALTHTLQEQARTASHQLASILEGLGYGKSSNILRTINYLLAKSVLLPSADVDHLLELLHQLDTRLAQLPARQPVASQADSTKSLIRQ